MDLFITYEDFSENTSSVRYNKELAAEYLGYLKQMASDFHLNALRHLEFEENELKEIETVLG